MWSCFKVILWLSMAWQNQSRPWMYTSTGTRVNAALWGFEECILSMMGYFGSYVNRGRLTSHTRTATVHKLSTIV